MQLYLLENKKHHNPLSVKDMNTENYHGFKKKIPGVSAGVLHTSWNRRSRTSASMREESFKELRI